MSANSVIAGLITVTALSSYVNDKYIKLHKSIGLTLITFLFSLILMGAAHWGLDLTEPVRQFIYNIEFNQTFLNGMLSFLLFAVSLHVNVIELANQKWVVTILATVSVFVSTFIVGVATYFLAGFIGINISLAYCLVFGALISPTDPIAVLGLMKKIRVPKSLEVKIAGEALFNDAMGIVLFMCMLSFANAQSANWTYPKMAMFFIQQGIGGAVFGVLLGWFAGKLLRGVENYEVAILITLAVVTGGYTFAHEVLDVSGVIAMSIAGLMVGTSLRNCAMCKETVSRLDAFWELIDEVLNAILFVLIGLEFIRLTFGPGTTLLGIGCIGIVLLARWVSVAIPLSIFSYHKRFTKGVITVMTWGGLRGGIAIALALTIPPSPERNLIVAVTYAVVIFSIVVQGLTIGKVIEKTVCARKEPEALPE